MSQKRFARATPKPLIDKPLLAARAARVAAADAENRRHLSAAERYCSTCHQWRPRTEYTSADVLSYAGAVCTECRFKRMTR